MSIAYSDRQIRQSIDSQLGLGNGTRYVLEDRFEQIPKLIAASETALSTQTLVREYLGASKNFLLRGTNPTSAFSPGGGLLLGTGATASDRAVISPDQLGGPIAFSAWNETSWNTDAQPRLDIMLSIADITTISLVAGLAVSAPTGTDEEADGLGAEAAVFAFNPASAVSATNFRRLSLSGGAVIDQAIPANVGVPALAVNTRVGLSISLDITRRVNFAITIGGRQFYCGGRGGANAALAANTKLVPFVYIRTLSAAIRTVAVRSMRCSRIAS